MKTVSAMSDGQLSNVSGQRVYMTAEQMIEKVLTHGQIHIFGNGKQSWSANCEMYATGEGVKFTVKSGYNCKSIHECLTILCERIDKAIEDINNTGASG